MTTRFALLLSLASLTQISFADELPVRRGHSTPVADVSKLKSAKVAESAQTLPPLPDGIAQLKFAEIFKTPFGDYGPEYTEKAKSLDGQKVRILGYMVREDTSPDNCNPSAAPLKRPAWMSSVIPGRIMFTPEPVEVSMSHYALCDDLPIQTVFVTVPERFGERVPYVRGLVLLTGTLSIGNKAEPDGRISAVRLLLDPAPATNHKDEVAAGSPPANTLSMSNPQPEIKK